MSKIAYFGSILIFGIAITSFVLSFVAPDINVNFIGIIKYQQSLTKTNFTSYCIVSFLTMAWAFVSIKVWGNLKEVLYKINLKHPFSIDIANKLVNVAYFLFGLWLVAFIGNVFSDFVAKIMEGVERGFDANFSFLIVAGIVFIIAQIFKSGVEIQNENDLTI